MTIESRSFGSLDGADVPAFVLRNRHGVALHVTALGARLTALHMPDARGHSADVVLGFDTPAEYLASNAYMGATCGRFGGRIRGGAFTLDGRLERVACNEGRNHLHGGISGFDRKLWQAQADPAANEVLFTLVSPDGDEGYPGTLSAETRYILRDDNVVTIAMRAQTDRATVVNLIHHSYWNLAGHDSGDIRAHRLRINADFYTPIDEELIETGEVRSVEGTPFDFRTAAAIGRDLDRVPTANGGYDHNWCLNGQAGTMRPAAELVDPASGRRLQLLTNAPGLQFYAGGHFRMPVRGKAGAGYRQYAGLTLETQHFPNAPNIGHFPGTRLGPGERCENRMEIRLHSGA